MGLIVETRYIHRVPGAGKSPEPPAPSCSITLTTEFNAAFGISEAQIDGQRVFIDNVGSSGIYGATTDFDNPRSLWQSGTRWIEMQDIVMPANDGQPFVGFVSSDGSKVVQGVMLQAGQFQVVLIENGTPQEALADTASPSDNVAIGISADGDVRAIINSTEMTLNSGYLGFWDTDIALYNGFQGASAGESGSLLAVTCSGNYNNDFSGISGDKFDLGGNAL